MNEQSAAELEHEAEAIRSRVADTAESLKAKLTPGQIIDELTSVFSGSGGSDALSNLKLQVQENPLPLVMVGTGLAWLMFGKGPNPAARQSEPDQAYVYGDWMETPGRRKAQSDDDASVGEDMMSVMSDKASSVAEGAADMVSSIGEAVRGTAKDLQRKAGDSGQVMQGGFQTILAQDPFVLAALGVALGTAIGAALPRTELEDETLGAMGDQLRTAAGETLTAGVEQATEAAERAFDAAKEEADRQGLVPRKTAPQRFPNVSAVSWARRRRQLRKPCARSEARCLVSGFDGALFSSESKDALWARFYTAAPRRQRRSVEQYKIVKRA